MNRLVLLAGGGTVGHLAPGFALRDALAPLGFRAVFVTPGEEREHDWFPAAEPTPIHVPAPRLPRRAFPAAAFPGRMAAAVHRALGVLRRTRPAAVVALGGWPCAPTALAALSARVPLALIFADAVPGVVVRRLQPLAGRTYVPTEEARAALARPERGVVVGRPVRRAVLDAVADPARFGLRPGVPTLLVMGGSLGARALNSAVLLGIAEAVRERPDLPVHLQVIHSTGGGGEAENAAAAYRALGVRAFTAAFVSDVGTALATADLVLCRSGASTVAEVEALSKPAVFVPYPHHEDRQQFENAAPLVSRGAAAVVEEAALSPAAFRREVVLRLFDGERLAEMAGAARRARAACGPTVLPAAAIATDLVRWLEGRRTAAGSRARWTSPDVGMAPLLAIAPAPRTTG